MPFSFPRKTSPRRRGPRWDAFHQPIFMSSAPTSRHYWDSARNSSGTRGKTHGWQTVMTYTSLHRHRGMLVCREPSYYERVAGGTPPHSCRSRGFSSFQCRFLYSSNFVSLYREQLRKSTSYNRSHSLASKVIFVCDIFWIYSLHLTVSRTIKLWLRSFLYI